MRFTKGKWVASYKDVWSLDDTLNEIILAGLVKFKDVLENSTWKGVPADFVDADSEEPDFESWMTALDKMIYAFDCSHEPTLSHFDIRVSLSSLNSVYNQPNFQLYQEAWEVHKAKVKEGRELFIKYYDSLWV